MKRVSKSNLFRLAKKIIAISNAAENKQSVQEEKD